MADKLMQGRRGLIMGVANDHSIAWAIARAAHEQGAELGFTYQGDAFLKRAKPLVDQVEGAFLENCDVTRDGDYNVMGVAKAALEASVRYIAVDLGPQQIRANAISAGPMRTISGSAVGDARYVYSWTRDHAPLQRAITQEDVGGAGVYFLSDLSAGVTGEVHHVDSGFNVMGMVNPHRIHDKN